MRLRPQNVSALIIVAILSLVLTWAVSDGVFARSTFQSEPPFTPEAPTETPTATATATALPTDLSVTATKTATVTQTPVLFITTTFTPIGTPGAAASPVPLPPLLAPETSPPAPAATPTGTGFLAPPTLTNPDSALPGRSTLPQTGAQPPLVGPAVQPVEPAAGEVGVTPEVSGPAQLIDSGIIALSYLWLCCGVIFLVVAALVVVWLARRSRTR